MNGWLSVVILNSIMWIITGCVIIFSIFKTGELYMLWFLLIPALCSFTYISKNDDII